MPLCVLHNVDRIRMGMPKARSRNVSDLALAAFCPRLYSRTFCSAVSLPMLTSCDLTRRVISRGTTYGRTLPNLSHVIEIIHSCCHPITAMSSNQQRIKTTGPTKLTSLAQPMMFNDASDKVPRHQWSCDREAAVWTTFVAAVCRRIIVLGSRRGLDTMLPLPFGVSIKF